MPTYIKGNDTSTFGGDVDLGANNLTTTGTLPAPAALSTASGSAPSYSARAWINFNGTGTIAIRASGNISSITDYGTGYYGITFTTAMADADYAVAGTNGEDPSAANANIQNIYDTSAPTSSGFRIINYGDNGTQYDVSRITFAIFR